MCSLIQVFLLCSCCLVFVLFLFCFYLFFSILVLPTRKKGEPALHSFIVQGIVFQDNLLDEFCSYGAIKAVFFFLMFFFFKIKLFTSFFYILNAVEPKASWSTSLVIKTVFLLSSNCFPCLCADCSHVVIFKMCSTLKCNVQMRK